MSGGPGCQRIGGGGEGLFRRERDHLGILLDDFCRGQDGARDAFGDARSGGVDDGSREIACIAEVGKEMLRLFVGYEEGSCWLGGGCEYVVALRTK